jgi:hypothetical protein
MLARQILTMAGNLTYGVTKRNARSLIYLNYEFWKKREGNEGDIHWICSKHQRFHCKATLKTNGDAVIGDKEPEHTHSGNVANALARKAVGAMREKMTETVATPSSAQGAVVVNLDDHVLMALPKRQNYGDPIFTIATWNKYTSAVDGIARTTNIVEGWHHGLQSLFMCSHPTMWKFFQGLDQDCTKQRAAFLQATAGSQQQPTKRYRELSLRVSRAVGAYTHTDILTYLRSIAYLSHA